MAYFIVAIIIAYCIYAEVAHRQRMSEICACYDAGIDQLLNVKDKINEAIAAIKERENDAIHTPR